MGNKQAVGFEDLSKVTVDTDIDIKNIDDELHNLFKFKILLLGTGESGKSTILKQLKLLHKKKLTQKDLKVCAEGIHQAIIDCMKALIMARRNFGVYEVDEEGKRTEADLESWDDDNKQGTKIDAELGQRIKRLFESEAIQKTYARRSEFWILDGCAWYMANIERVTEEGWVPTEDDCMMARVRTTGIIVTDLEVIDEKGAKDDQTGEITPNRIVFQVVDVGGQRNERKKWIHCFDDVKCILFVDNLAGYNAVMFEDNTKNRMVESLELFNKITYQKAFEKTPVFLILNKRDLFEQMIKETDMSVTFPEYKGGKDMKNALEFVQSNFRKQAPPRKPVHIQAISARFQREVRLAFEEVKQQVYGKEKERLMEQMKDLQGRRAARVADIEKAHQTRCGCGGGKSAPSSSV